MQGLVRFLANFSSTEFLGIRNQRQSIGFVVHCRQALVVDELMQGLEGKMQFSWTIKLGKVVHFERWFGSGFKQRFLARPYNT
jgi:hypothetical protein